MKRSFGIVNRIVFVLVFGALLSLFTSVEAKARGEIYVTYGENVQGATVSHDNYSGPFNAGDIVPVTITLSDGYEYYDYDSGHFNCAIFIWDTMERSYTSGDLQSLQNVLEVVVTMASDQTTSSSAGTARIYIYTRKIPYDVIVNSGGHGTASAVSGLVNGKAGVDDQVTLSATPDPGYEFDRWETNSGITINTTDNPATFTMIAGPVSVRAKFKSTGNASSSSSGTTATTTPAPRTRPKDDDDDDDDHHEDEPAPAPKPVDPNAVIGMSFAGNLTGNVRIGPQVQGLAAQYAFRMGTPKGWKEAFTFNMTVNDKADYSLKKGTLSFRIPTQYQKAGRKYAILGLDKNGKVKVFNDIDLKFDTITVNLDIEGYAFDLIYCD